MAFRQPTFAPTARPTTASVPQQQAGPTRPTLQTHALEDSREWILFPSAQADSAASYTQATSTDRTPRTAGLSLLSDFGSLNTAARSGQEEDLACESTNGSLDNEEDEELDSLDEGLHAFQEPSRLLSEHFHASSNSILPRHDGLGGFPTATPGLEEQGSWHFDQHGASRKRSFGHHRRRTSDVQRGIQEAIDGDDHSAVEEERRERIEKWRLDHSRILLNEIEKETRRRRVSFISQDTTATEQEPSLAGLEGFGQIIRDELAEANRDGRTLGASATTDATETESEEMSESFWQRLTRRVIRDFIGMDDATLSVIFGESLALPEEKITSGSPPSKAPRLDESLMQSKPQPESTWERRLIERVTRELGILLNQLSDHPGAFSTPSLFNPSTSDYAGMPVTQPTSSRTPQPRPTLRSTTSAPAIAKAASPTSFTFNPTLQEPGMPSASALETSSHAALWGIEEEPSRNSEQEYWESTPDLKTIFQRFLQTRFPSTTNPASSSLHRLTSSHNIAPATTADRLRRAALIRQYHPLTSRAATAQHRRRRSWLRGGSSCASESAKRSRVGKSSLSTSRNYWDLGGSSIAASVGAGGWGEV